MRVLCFDIGGTKIKYSLVEDISEIETKSIETRKTINDNYILEDVINVINEYKGKFDAVGISTAGVVDALKGEVIFAGPTIPNYTGTKFKDEIEKSYKVPCFVENDVNSAAYGEYIYGKYKGSMFCMTIGTGVGGSFIIDGKIFRGNSQTAGEIGYLPMNKSHFQNFSSATFLTKFVSEKLGMEVDGEYIFENARKGDEICNEAINLLVENLSQGILSVLYILNPENIVIGGGITAQGKYLENKIVEYIDKNKMGNQFESNIKLAKLKNNAGIVGIYYIVKEGVK